LPAEHIFNRPRQTNKQKGGKLQPQKEAGQTVRSRAGGRRDQGHSEARHCIPGERTLGAAGMTEKFELFLNFSEFVIYL